MMSDTTEDGTRQNRVTERVQNHLVAANASRLFGWLRLERLAPTKFGELFGADLRSLAALRISLAFIVLMDLVARLPDMRVHYSDQGVFPRSLLVDSFVRWRWSLNLINDTVEFQVFLLLAAIGAAMCMLLGFHTRVMVLAVWILVVSLQVRNPYVLSGADTLLRVLLFWSMFLPLGAVWSMDAAEALRCSRLSSEPFRWQRSAYSCKSVSCTGLRQLSNPVLNGDRTGRHSTIRWARIILPSRSVNTCTSFLNSFESLRMPALDWRS
jgi:hypothetical protein